MQEHPSRHTDNSYPDDPEFSFGQLTSDWLKKFKWLLKHKRILLIAAIVGILAGCLYAWRKHITYKAKLSFIVEDAKSAGGSIMSALSGQLGLDLGGLSGGSGILAGDNVQALVKSQSLIKRTLLTPYFDTGNYSLANRYIDVTGLKEKWLSSKKVARAISFPCSAVSFDRVEDSLMQTIIKKITEDELAIAKPDKKLNIFELQANTEDERLSQLLCERLLKTTADFYIDTKTSRLKNNISRLQHRADSIGVLLNQKTVAATQSEVMLLDGNPAFTAPTASAEIQARNKTVLATIYAEIVKNLEISKTALVQETPAIQVIDYPELPLKKNQVKWYIAAFAGMLIALLVTGGLMLMLRPQPKSNT